MSQSRINCYERIVIVYFQIEMVALSQRQFDLIFLIVRNIQNENTLN